MSESTQPAASTANVIAAWCVHLLTMSGLVWVLFAIRAMAQGEYQLMWLWLGIALVTDSIDGPLARLTRASEVIPWFSGAMMDNIIDYTTWTFVPSVFMAYALDLGPQPLPQVAAAMAMLSSMFCYANTKMKSADWYFVGFPAAWNIVAVILWLFGQGAVFNWAVIVIFTALALIPWKWVHPFRVRHLRVANAIATVLWIISTAWWVAIYPAAPLWLVIPWFAFGVWILGVSALRTIRGPQKLGK